jgi:nucleotide-binding universal stress UspA family protein
MFPGRQVERRRVASDDILATILAETRLGYGVLALGASESPSPDQLLSAVVDDVLIRCPIPMLVARRATADHADPPPASDIAFSRVLVPVAGSAASRGAQEVAYGLAHFQRASVSLVHVVTRPHDGTEPQRSPGWPPRPRDRMVASQGRPPGIRGRTATSRGRSSDQTAQRVLRDAAQFAARYGIGVHTRIRRAPASGEEIVRQASEIGADLIVLGATARSVDGRPFLGHSVEHVLAHAGCAVVVAVLPAHDTASEPTEQPAGTGDR